MAQDYVGSNNINLLLPKGQFGTRLCGGKDSASERYIFTELNKITRCIFPEADDGVLTYLDDDGALVEPKYYVPIIPMVLVNGCKGIGTGFSTDIMCYNPLDIINYILETLKTGFSNIELNPYYEGFGGSITKIANNKYVIKGCYEHNGQNKIRITELPIGSWTDDYKKFIESLMDKSKKDKKGNIVKDYVDMSTDKKVDITITLSKDTLSDLETTKHEYCNGIEKTFKLCTTQSTSNMYLFDSEDSLKKYKDPKDIIEDHFSTRLNMYKMRKEALLKTMSKELKVLSNKARYILELLNDTLDLRKKKRQEIYKILEDKKFDIDETTKDFKYLLKMPMDSVSEENVEKLMKDKENIENDIKTLTNTSIQKIWIEELNKLLKEYIKYRDCRSSALEKKVKIKKSSKKSKLKVKD